MLFWKVTEKFAMLFYYNMYILYMINYKKIKYQKNNFLNVLFCCSNKKKLYRG